MSRLNRAPAPSPAVAPPPPPPTAASPALPPAAPPVAVPPPEELQLMPGAVRPPVSTASVLPDQPAVVDLVLQIVNSQRKAGQSFLLCVTPEDERTYVESYPTLEELIKAMRTRLDSKVKVQTGLQAFLGYHLPFTKGPFRFLKTPFGASIPLFDMQADNMEEEEHGWIGDPFLDPTITAPEEVAVAPAAPRLEADDVVHADAPPDDTSPFDVGGRSGE